MPSDGYGASLGAGQDPEANLLYQLNLEGCKDPLLQIGEFGLCSFY